MIVGKCYSQLYPCSTPDISSHTGGAMGRIWSIVGWEEALPLTFLYLMTWWVNLLEKDSHLTIRSSSEILGKDKALKFQMKTICSPRLGTWTTCERIWWTGPANIDIRWMEQ
ncbi:hypothetical protein KIL84_013836 [Mauremys mutica]|uniref:Uncharacterized protein n=1 Tax=Mauremys mutica TaxID=74926 RepID=A0A9D4AUM8_9SAUR|nr:hypothetical protein KIL84_013836 [Mauremys mutica]